MFPHDLEQPNEKQAIPQSDYEYWGLMASTWDLLLGNTSNWEDLFFYRELIARRGQPVLEVGCGSGRLLLNYLADGIDIDGVDISPEVLALCRQKAHNLGLQPTLFQQSMEALALPRRYRTMIVPAGSFQLITGPDAARQTMQRFLAHLEPGGVLAMHLMILWQPGEPKQTEWKLTGDATRPEDEARVQRWSRAGYEVENQLEHTEDRYEVVLQGKIIASEYHRRSPATRWYSQSQAVKLYQEAGFSDIRLARIEDRGWRMEDGGWGAELILQVGGEEAMWPDETSGVIAERQFALVGTRP